MGAQVIRALEMLNNKSVAFPVIFIQCLLQTSASSPAPMLVVSAGCSASSYLGSMIAGFLTAKGITSTPPTLRWEAFKPVNNPFYTPKAGMTHAIKNLAMEAARANKTLLVKCEPPRLRFAMLSVLKQLKFKAIYYERNNVLDRLVCNVRDCFSTTSTSYPVLASSGKKTDLCFQRRYSNVTTKAFLDTRTLAKQLRSLRFWMPKYMKKKAFGCKEWPVFNFDTLYGYEYSESKFGTSVIAWQRLMKCFGVTIEPAVIDRILRPQMNSRLMKPHSDAIYNIEEVIQELRKNQNADLLQYLRT